SRFLSGIASWTVIHLPVFQPEARSKNPRHCLQGFAEKLKLTVKPLSFGYSVVDSHSSARVSNRSQKQKPPPLLAGVLLKS
ncbi:hypothetical protein ACVUOP_002922, partial [Klebsiella oxytoca]